MYVKLKHVAAAFLFIMFAACKKEKAEPAIVVITASGDIIGKINEFKNLLGATLNTTTGVTGGHREINWDGVPDDLLGKPLPSDFFNPKGPGAVESRQRGLGYTGNGTFMVSKTNFAEINMEASTEFAAFSSVKTFANVDASLWDIAFEVAGTSTAATTKGFGAVFADVDVANSTFLEFFSNTKSLGKYYVPVQGGGTKFSFLGVYFKNETVTSVRIGHSGTLKDGTKDVSKGGTSDLIVIDDFLYSEPVAK